MPVRPKTICRRTCCQRAIPEPGYCEQHKQFASGWTDTSKVSSTARGYGWAWRQLRERVLSRDAGLCQICFKKHRVILATEVDHILAKAKGGTDDMINLQAICKACHKKKTITDRLAVKKRYAG